MVSTGELPQIGQVKEAVTEAYERYRPVEHGAVADYIPALASAAPELFGICVVGARGRFFEIGDVDGASRSRASPSRSSSRSSVRRSARGGASAAGGQQHRIPVQLLDGCRAERRADDESVGQCWCDRDHESCSRQHCRGEVGVRFASGLSRFAGRDLTMSDDVYASESATNLRNQGIAHLLASYQRLYFDPDEATDVYTRQCSLDVTVHDLAVMAATLANGGVNPMTGVRVVGPGCAVGCWRRWPPPACTSCRGTGCTRSGCRARAVSAAAS